MYNMSMEQLGKALGLIKLLNEKGKVNSLDVAKEFNVSVRTAQRYLLEATRILPIQTEETGKNKLEYSLMESYSFKESLMNTSEISILSALIDYAKGVLGKNKGDFLDVVKKKLFYANTHCQTHQILEKQAIDFKKITKINEKLNEYIISKTIIDVYYERYKKTYRLEPYKILYWEGFWYLIANHDNVIKKFLLDYMGDIKPTKKTFNEIPSGLTKIINDANNIWFEGGKRDKVTVELNADIAPYFKRKLILTGQKIVKEKKDGNIIVEFDVYNEKDLFHQLIVWLPNFRIIEPRAYLSYIKKEMKQGVIFNGD